MEQTQFSWGKKKDCNDWKNRARNNEVFGNSLGPILISWFAFIVKAKPVQRAKPPLTSAILNFQDFPKACKKFLQVSFGTALLWQWFAELQVSEVHTKHVLNFALYLAYYSPDKESQDTAVSELWSVSQERHKHPIAHPLPRLFTSYHWMLDNILIGYLNKIVGEHEMKGNPICIYTRQQLKFWPILIINFLNNLSNLRFWCNCLWIFAINHRVLKPLNASHPHLFTRLGQTLMIWDEILQVNNLPPAIFSL